VQFLKFKNNTVKIWLNGILYNKSIIFCIGGMKMKKLIIGGLIIVVGVCAGSFKVATNIMDDNAAKSKSPTENVDKPQIAEAKATSVLTKPVTGTVQSGKVATRIEIVTTCMKWQTLLY